MSVLRYDGRNFPVASKPTVKDAIWIETTVGKPLSKMGEAETFAVTVLMTLRKAGMALRWEDVLEMDLDEIEVIDDEDPTTTGAEAGASDETPS